MAAEQSVSQHTAEQGVAQHTAIVVAVAPPLAHHHGEASPSSSPRGSSLVKAIDRKARSYLKSFERSFSFSMAESRGEDPSSMTIEFLRARLQAQRAEYKAEKQRAQQLAKKVFELEQRLNFEIERRKKAERNDMLISPSYHSNTPLSKDTQFYKERGECLALINSKFKENSSGEDDHSDLCSVISGSEGHPDGDGVLLISPSSLRRRWESLRHERQQMAHQHGSYVAKDINAISVLDTESSTLIYKELRDKPCEAPSCDESLEGPKGSVDLENTNLHAVTTKLKQDSTSEMLNTSHSIDSQPLRMVNTFDIPTSRHKVPFEAGHTVFQNYPHRQASTFYDAERSFISESSQNHMYATKARTCRSINYLACQNCQQTFSKSPISPLDKMVSANLSPRRGIYVQDAQRSLEEANAGRPEFGTLEDTNISQFSEGMSVGHDMIFDSNKEMHEERPSLRQAISQEHESKLVKAMLFPDFKYTINNHEISPIQQNTEKLHIPYKRGTFNPCGSFSAVQTRHRGNLHGHRMSLDGGLDRLQEVGRALEDGKAAVSFFRH